MKWRWGGRPEVVVSEPAFDPVIELAYIAAIKAVEQQDVTLAGLRNRAAGLLSALTVATTFGAGLGLFSGDSKGPTLPIWSQWTLLALLVGTGGLSIAVMWPVRVVFGADAHQILQRRRAGIDIDIDAMRLYLTEELIAGHRRNAGVLGKKFRLYRYSIFALTGQVAVLVFALILKGA